MSTPAPPPSIRPDAVPPWALEPGCPRAERYLLGPELGRGGMGRVHLAWDPMLRRRVALKLLHGDDPELHLRMLREARAQARLEHPNICRIHDLGDQDGRPFIAMQLVEGRSLAALRPQLGFREAAGLLADVAGAVHAAHRSGVIHRDLKPANILVEGEGPYRAVVVDFGLARDFQAFDQTLSWAVLGTPAFMSPEQARGEALGPATDIYSLGATLYAMLTGTPPYEGSTLAGLLTQQGQRGVRALRRLKAEVPRDLETVTLKCLELRPADRYPTALALEQDLRRFLAGEPVRARPVGLAGLLLRWARRKPALAITAAAGILAAAVLGGWNLRASRLAASREAAAQRFGMEIRDAEHLLRIERMMPLHDIRPAEARLRARMEAIRAEMDRLGGASRGPGRYALGRGSLALRDYRKALEHLQASWDAGFQAPEVAYSLGLAHFRQFLADTPDPLRAFSDKVFDSRVAAHLSPAAEWFQRSLGAAVESPAYGRTMVAMVQGRTEEAARRFDQALEEAPWLYEALLGKAENLDFEQLNRLRRARSHPDLEQRQASIRLKRALVAQAQRLAPSDADLRVALGDLWTGLWVELSAHGDRNPVPLAEAEAAYNQARAILPDSVPLAIRSANTSMQLGFLELATGGDPGARLAAAAEAIDRMEQGSPQLDATFRTNLLGLSHNLWWTAMEADVRFGRDPARSLAGAAAARRTFHRADVHFGYSLMLEARDRDRRRLDPFSALDQAEANFQRLFSEIPEQRDTFFARMILGEVHLLRAEMLHARGRDPGAALQLALAELATATKMDPKAAYPYYSLPRVHALAARVALGQGRNAAAPVRSALEAGRRGAAVNPRNAQIQQALADAHLADAQQRMAGNGDPRPALDAARRALDAADAVNPRDFRSFLLRAEVELAAARLARRQGQAAGAELRRCEAAARRGLALKGDEPRFRTLRASARELGQPPEG